LNISIGTEHEFEAEEGGETGAGRVKDFDKAPRIERAVSSKLIDASVQEGIEE
jgi:hypothetical protein